MPFIPVIRKCERCGKTGGLAAHAGLGYWHLTCFRKDIKEGVVDLNKPNGRFAATYKPELRGASRK